MSTVAHEQLCPKLSFEIADLLGQRRSHLFHRTGQDESWAAWYASYIVAEQTGTDLPA